MFAAGLWAGVEQAEPLSARVIVLANSDDAESLQLARYYMEKRQVPAANLVAVPMPRDESIDWRQLVDSIYQPVQDELVKRDWIQAIGMEQKDKVGRKKYAVSGHRIAYLVICRGVPLRVEDDKALYEASPLFADNVQFRTNAGSVDAELALLARSGYAINAAVPNPLFSKSHPTFLDEALVVKVARIDGPTYADAAALVDNALKAEERGLIGRAYVDLGGPHLDGDKWLEAAVREIDALGFDLEVERTPAVFGSMARFDSPALYFGWYSGELGGPFAPPDFRFPPGAIALHIHSFSALTLRSATTAWCGPLIARGVTATFGNVHEPYLQFTHQPNLVMRALAEGKNLGDAAYFALPVLSWQAVVIGDPLYRPFAVSWADQWSQRVTLSDALFPYVVFRELRRLEKAGQNDLALKTAVDALHERPGLVLALRTAELLKAAGDNVGARHAIDAVLPLRVVSPEMLPVAAQVAQVCVDLGAAEKALGIYRTLLAIEAVSLEQRLRWLPLALKAAEAASATDTLDLWQRMFRSLSSGPVPATKN